MSAETTTEHVTLSRKNDNQLNLLEATTAEIAGCIHDSTSPVSTALRLLIQSVNTISELEDEKESIHQRLMDAEKRIAFKQDCVDIAASEANKLRRFSHDQFVAIGALVDDVYRADSPIQAHNAANKILTIVDVSTEFLGDD